MIDKFGTPLELGDVVVQNIRKSGVQLRYILEFKGDRVRLSAEWAYSSHVNVANPSWVDLCQVSKYHNQEFFNVRNA